jgi:hypothetical protein
MARWERREVVVGCCAGSCTPRKDSTSGGKPGGESSSASESKAEVATNLNDVVETSLRVRTSRRIDLIPHKSDDLLY